jgi:hypothetical protein
MPGTEGLQVGPPSHQVESSWIFDFGKDFNTQEARDVIDQPGTGEKRIPHFLFRAITDLEPGDD